MSIRSIFAQAALSAASYTSQDLRNEVAAALVAYYGTARVTPRNKCILVTKREGYVDADVVPCLEYRWYRNPDSIRDYVEGIAINPIRGGLIINFPKEHIENGKRKNVSCLERYKPTVRQMKHVRNRAVAGVLPSRRVKSRFWMKS